MVYQFSIVMIWNVVAIAKWNASKFICGVPSAFYILPPNNDMPRRAKIMTPINMSTVM